VVSALSSFIAKHSPYQTVCYSEKKNSTDMLLNNTCYTALMYLHVISILIMQTVSLPSHDHRAENKTSQ